MLAPPRITEVSIAGHRHHVLNHGIQKRCQEAWLRIGVAPYLVAAKKQFRRIPKGPTQGRNDAVQILLGANNQDVASVQDAKVTTEGEIRFRVTAARWFLTVQECADRRPAEAPDLF
jgi:hypothetical protein